MKISIIILNIITVFIISPPLWADCNLDHLFVACNEDGIPGTEDDKKLYVECLQKYRRSDPEHPDEHSWLNWHYPLYYSEIYQDYSIGEPGFDYINAPERRLTGRKDIDYRIIIECVSITPGFRVVKRGTGAFTIDQPGDYFNYSSFTNPHIHLKFRGPRPDCLYWITFRMYDEIDDGDQYESSDVFTLVFNQNPLPGDIRVDGVVDEPDLFRLVECWLLQDGRRENDYYERADMNRDGRVDLLDFAFLAANWLEKLSRG